MTKQTENPSKQARARGEQMRSRAAEMAKKRKEEYLGARVPKALRDKVIKEAEAQGLPVSLLIRKVLEQAFGETAPVAKIATVPSTPPQYSVSSSAESPRSPFADVLGWEKIELNQGAVCANCHRTLAEGSKASLGISATGRAPVLVCNQCKDVI